MFHFPNKWYSICSSIFPTSNFYIKSVIISYVFSDIFIENIYIPELLSISGWAIRFVVCEKYDVISLELQLKYDPEASSQCFSWSPHFIFLLMGLAWSYHLRPFCGGQLIDKERLYIFCRIDKVYKIMQGNAYKVKL